MRWRALGVVPEPSDVMEIFKESLDEFDSDWKMYELNEQPRQDLINNDIFLKAQVEIRDTIDRTIIKDELKTLKIAYAQDLGTYIINVFIIEINNKYLIINYR